MLVIVVHHVDDRYQRRDVTAGLARQVVVNLPEVALPSAAGNGLVDVARTTVVGRYGQRPVVEHTVQVAEVTGRSVRGFDRVAALVDDRVDLKVIDAAGVVHELPQSGGAHTGGCFGIQGALDDGEIFHLVGHPVAVKGFLEQRKVFLLL